MTNSMLSFFGFSIPIIYLHLGTLFLTIPIILAADIYGSLWLKGKRQTLDPKILTYLHRGMWTGLILMILTGASMFWPLREYLLHTPAFYIKMMFVLTLVINGFFVGRFLEIATERPFVELTPQEKKLLYVSGVASFIGWVGAIIAALSLGL